MTTTTKPRTAGHIGTCLWNTEHVFHSSTAPVRPLTPCPTCEPIVTGTWTQRANVKWTTVKGRVTSTECGAECRSAKSAKCSCSCGGDHHGEAWGLIV